MPVAIDRGRVVAALPGYDVGGQLGAGAYGLVLAGRHRGLGRQVAIKVVSTGSAQGVGAGFKGEARVLAGLRHPHIVDVYDYVERGDLHLIIMEFLPGGTLTRRRRALSAQEACAVGLAVADALTCAHTAGILHRDIKPDNMLFTADGLLKVTDFGLAKMFSGTAVTASAAVGTPQYMAPEQIDAGRLGPATDLYALGVVLYELLSGAPPFDPTRLSLAALYRHHLEVAPAPPVGVPAPLAGVVLRMLAKDPAGRYPSAHAFALDLAGAAARTYGPRWASRSGLTLRLADDVREAADLPASGHSAGGPPTAGQGARGTPSARATRAPLTPQHTPPRRGWPRHRWVFVAVALVAVLAGLVAAYATGNLGGGPPARVASSAPGLIRTSSGTVIAGAAQGGSGQSYQRWYPYGALYAAISGYRSPSLPPTGLEQSQDDVLRGRDSRVPAGQAATVVTSINDTIQRAAADQLNNSGARGAVVALDPRTGAVLAMVTSPSYDPNPLTSPAGSTALDTHTALENDPSQPLLNRATQQTYPPGSTFEVVTAAAALSEGVVGGVEDLVFAPEELPLPQTNATLPNVRDGNCRQVSGEGTTLLLALQTSCNTAFGQLGLDLGDDRLRAQAEKFGINQPLDDFPLPSARSVFPPDLDPAQTAQSAVGQRDVRVTPLQMAEIVGAIANGGDRMQPYLVEALLGPDGDQIERTKPRALGKSVSSDIAGEITLMMQKVVEEGTGTAAQIPGVPVAGKTGTAEYGDPVQGAHAWFVGFAPVGNPSIAVAVVVEDGGPARGTGSKTAAPIARAVLEAALGTRG